MLTSHALERNNLADALLGYMVVTWEVVNAKQAARQPDGVASLRTKMRAALARDSRISAMSDAGKQRQAETLAYLAVLAADSAPDLQLQGNQAGLARLREDVRRTAMRTIGVDVQGLRLTANGLGR